MLYLPRLFVYHADAEPGSVQSETFKVMERRLLRGDHQSGDDRRPGCSASGSPGRASASGRLAARQDRAWSCCCRACMAICRARCGVCRGPQRKAGAALADHQRSADSADDRHRHPGGREAVLSRLSAAQTRLALCRSRRYKTGLPLRLAPLRCHFEPALPARFAYRRYSPPFLPRAPPHAGNETPRTQEQEADRSDRLRRIARGRERQRHAQAGADVRDPQEAGRAGRRDHRRRRGRGAAGRLRLPALGQRQLSAGSGRYLHLALADPALLAEDRRYGRRADPQPEGRRALFRAAQGQHDQFRRSGKDPAQDPFRQSDAALSDRAAQDGDREPDHQGHLAARHRPGGAARQGPARA